MLPEGPLNEAGKGTLGQTPLYDLKLLSEAGENALVLHTSPVNNQQRNSEDIVGEDLIDSLRFVHGMAMQTRHMALNTRVNILTLIEELIAKGNLDLLGFDERRDRVAQREQQRTKKHISVNLADNVDKYSLKTLPDIDCNSLIPICKGRCCMPTVQLSIQDLDERKLEWNYKTPYNLRRGSDGYCIYSCPNTRNCLEYKIRPGICRVYDCRQDKRVWEDFEKRIPAADDVFGNNAYILGRRPEL